MTLGRAILEVLDAARESRPLTATAVLGLIANDLPKPPSLSEVKAECGRLENREEIVSLDDVDRGRVYSITAKGRARALS